MKISCGIIKDLLPLYLDSVCSNESKAAIDEHLEVCNNCKTELQFMQQSLPFSNTEQNLNEAEAIKNLSKVWKKGMNKSMRKGIFITLIVIVALVVIANFLSIFFAVGFF